MQVLGLRSQVSGNPVGGAQQSTENLDPKTRAGRKSSRGYILITMMLFMALVAMAAMAILPKLAQQAQRDREEEMVHRGTEYMRAVKKYYKKFGRYPTRIEELENTNQQRFLRKRFKDPMAKGNKGDQDFRLVRVGDPALNMLGMGGIGAGPGIAPGALGGAAGGNSNFVAAPNGGVRQAGPNDANAPQVTGLPGQQTPQTAKPTGDDSGDADTADDAKSAGSSSNSANSGSGDAPGGQVFGGGPFLGVASTSKLKTIREYNKKNHYNDWLFIYDPNSDRSAGLLKGPIEPDAARNAGINPGTPIVPGQPNPPGPPPAQGPQPSPQPSQDDQ